MTSSIRCARDHEAHGLQSTFTEGVVDEVQPYCISNYANWLAVMQWFRHIGRATQGKRRFRTAMMRISNVLKNAPFVLARSEVTQHTYLHGCTIANRCRRN
jgi:hypothetical protein